MLDRSIEPALHEISRNRQIAFVAGLIDPTSRNSGAYLIHAAGRRLLSRKTEPDYSGNHEAARVSEDRPIPYGGYVISAVVCMDACNQKMEEALTERHNLLHANVARLDEPVLFCVPTRMGSFESRLLATRWLRQFEHRGQSATIILANGNGQQRRIR
jgi:hypothetical protein